MNYMVADAIMIAKKDVSTYINTNESNIGVLQDEKYACIGAFIYKSMADSTVCNGGNFRAFP